MSILISIIVPVYNSSEFLIKCLDSILQQTYSEFELLLINDGSTDNSGLICEKYADNDPRVKVFHKKNGGVSSARNFGLAQSKGEWICFVDSDDSVSENYISDFIKILNGHTKVDFVIQGFVKVKNDSRDKIDLGDKVVKANNFDELFNNLYIQNFGHPFSKFYNKQVIEAHHIIFPENYTIAEDLSFLLLYISKIKNIIFQKTYNYYYRYTENSLSNTLREPKIYFARYIGIKKVICENYATIYQDIYQHPKHYINFQHNVGSALFQSILSLYFFDMDRKSRIYFLDRFDDDDRKLLGFYKEKFKNPIFKFALSLLQKKNVNAVDNVLYSFFTVRKIFLKISGKPIPYKFKK